MGERSGWGSEWEGEVAVYPHFTPAVFSHVSFHPLIFIILTILFPIVPLFITFSISLESEGLTANWWLPDLPDCATKQAAIRREDLFRDIFWMNRQPSGACVVCVELRPWDNSQIMGQVFRASFVTLAGLTIW